MMMLPLPAAACMALLAVGLVLRLLGVPGGHELLAVAFGLLVVLPVVRLLLALHGLIRLREWRFVLVGLLVVGLLVSTLLWSAG